MKNDPGRPESTSLGRAACYPWSESPRNHLSSSASRTALAPSWPQEGFEMLPTAKEQRPVT